MTAPIPLIVDTKELGALANELRAAGRCAIDTEFVWERTYRPQLGVVQIATHERIAIVDAVLLKDLSPLFPVLRDPAVTKVLHGGGQDLEIMALLMGEPMRGVVDTQVVAAFLGYGLQVGLSVLLERVLRVRIKKDQTYTDWTRRPLKPEQVTYAQADVAHLLTLHDQLHRELSERGRDAWAREELRALEAADRFAPTPAAEQYLSVKGWPRLGGRDLAVLRALAAWRETAAQRANIRPHFIVNDVVLTTLAARPLDSIEELKQVRSLSNGTVERHGRAMLSAIRDGLACPESEWPPTADRVRRHAPPPGLGALLRAVVQAVADREDIAPEVIAPGRDIDALVSYATARSERPEPGEIPVLRGWRRDLVGDMLLAIARGELAIRYDVDRREVVGEAQRRGGRS